MADGGYPAGDCSDWGFCKSSPLGEYHAVWGFGANDIWAVGDPENQIRHWDGAHWSTVFGGQEGYTNDAGQVIYATLTGGTDLWGSSDSDLWSMTTNLGTALHYDGQVWSSYDPSSLASSYPGPIWGSSATDIWSWANGMIHWDGCTWTADVSTQGFNYQLMKMHGTGPSDIWAVGSQINDPNGGVLLHYDGSSWTASANPAMSTNDVFYDVFAVAPNDVWAVGDDASSVTSGTILHYDGTQWTQTATPPGPAQNSGGPTNLRAVWGSSTSDAWAFGDETLEGNTAVILHYDGTSWTNFPTAFTSFDSAYRLTLTAAWGSAANDVWAFGDQGAILHFDGTTWTQKEGGTINTITGIWGAASNDVWAAGDSDGTHELLHWDGSVWTTHDNPVVPPDGGLGVNLHRMSGVSASDIWAAADYGAWHWDGTSWSWQGQGIGPIPSGVLPIITYGVWADTPTSAWVGGQGGQIYEWDGSTWNKSLNNPADGSLGGFMSSGLNIESIWGFHGGGTIWAVGDTHPDMIGNPVDTILHYDPSDQTWTAVGDDNPIPSYFYDVRGLSETDVWAVGAGVIMHYDGVSWTTQPPVPSAYSDSFFYSVYPIAANDVWVAGTFGALLHWNGTGWTAATAPGDQSTYDFDQVFGFGQELWAAGSNGIIIHRAP